VGFRVIKKSFYLPYYIYGEDELKKGKRVSKRKINNAWKRIQELSMGIAGDVEILNESIEAYLKNIVK
jgi:hypothetical protein